MFDYLTGIYNITPTPFKPDGTLDEPSLRKLTEFTRGTRVNGMTILGVLGEADKLTERERERVTEIVIEPPAPFRFASAPAQCPMAASPTAASRRTGPGVMVARPSWRKPRTLLLERHYMGSRTPSTFRSWCSVSAPSAHHHRSS